MPIPSYMTHVLNMFIPVEPNAILHYIASSLHLLHIRYTCASHVYCIKIACKILH